ncbi:MAG: hypothetical protein JSU86_07175 [Phycisphaerales bacterium]|nr:MAG: hypothetical protein JSU86_07175 [Phycisphaerales bacterium]
MREQRHIRTLLIGFPATVALPPAPAAQGDEGVPAEQRQRLEANRLAFVVLQNSHWPIFTEANPQTVDDCTEVLIRVLRELLAPADTDEYNGERTLRARNACCGAC